VATLLILHMMKHLTTSLFLSALAVCVQAQNVANYQPDANGDGCIGSSDILSLLSLYGSGDCPPFECGDPLEYQGYEYATVQIGEDCWFAENLRSESYENGDAIPSGLSGAEWVSTASGATAVYGEGSSDCFDCCLIGNPCDEAWSLNEYGRLYNWYAVFDARHLCPSGWHVSTDDEWTVMTDFLGGDSLAASDIRATYGWLEGGYSTNSSGFTGLPGGRRSWTTGSFGGGGGGSAAYWWTASAVIDPNTGGFGGWNRYVTHDDDDVRRFEKSANNGYSIRCVQD